MAIELRVLMLEDNADDGELLALELRRAGFHPEWRRVEDRDGFLDGLGDHPDIVLVDYSLPQLTALDALALVREADIDVPVIVVSGVISEETCVQSLRHGAVDYLLKDRLTRLGPAVRHAIEQQRLRAERAEAEAAARHTNGLLEAVVEAAPAMVYLTDPQGRFVLVNSEFGRVFGVSPETAQHRHADSLPPHPLAVGLAERDARCLLSSNVVEAEESFLNGSTERVYLSTRYPLVNADDQVYGVAAIYTDITRQKRTEAELRAARGRLQQQTDELARANHELTELDRLKSQFLSTVSHELRTPLTSIRGYTEILADGAVGQLAEAQQRIVGIIDQNGKRLLTLIENLLNFARMESGGVAMNISDVDVAGALERAVATVQPSVTAHPSLALQVEVQPGMPSIRADAEQLDRALLNLLSNAVKFSPDGGVVTVRVAHDAKQVTIAVSDTGIGIPPDEQGRLFDRFFRSSAAQERSIPGTGLGLAITKTIVDAHSGHIVADSTPGAGTTFAIALPIGAAEPARRLELLN